MVPRIRWLTVTATLAVALGLVVAACGGGAEPTATPRPTAAPTATTAPPTATPPAGATAAPTTAAPAVTAAAVQPTATPLPTFAPPTPTAAPKPVRGGTLLIPSGSELQTKDPTKLYAFTFHYAMGQVYANIIKFKHRRWSDVEFEADLADSWTVSADGKVYTFKINPNARWQNLPPVNGRPVTAADIKWTYDLIADPAYGSAYRSRWPANIAGMEAPDAKTLVVRMSQPSAPFLLQLSNSIVKVVAREVYEKEGTFEKTIVGSGPYLFDRFDPGVRVVTKANPNFWKNGLDGKPLPYIDRIESLIIPDPAAQFAAIKTGRLAFITPGGLTYDQFLDMQKTAPQIVLDRDQRLTISIIRIHNGKKPWDNVLVRRALLKAFDQQAILTHIYLEPDAPFSGIVAPGIVGFELPQAELKQLLKYEPGESKRLLAQAGFPNGFEFELSTQYGPIRGALEEARMAFIQQSLSAAGFRSKLFLPAGSAAGTAYLYGKQYEVNLGTLPYDGIAWNYIRPAWHSQSSTNAMDINDPVLDKAIEDAETELDVAKQQQRVQDIQRYLLDKAYSVPVAQGWLYLAQQPWLKNYSRTWPWGHLGIEHAWIER